MRTARIINTLLKHCIGTKKCLPMHVQSDNSGQRSNKSQDIHDYTSQYNNIANAVSAIPSVPIFVICDTTVTFTTLAWANVAAAVTSIYVY